jgi:hypothetical protein
MEQSEIEQTYTAFEGSDLFAHGALDDVLIQVRKKASKVHGPNILIFSDSTGKVMDFDVTGTEKEMLNRLRVYRSPSQSTELASGPGRPKLGVIAREVSLLPRHWEWLATQTGGASATIRRLVEDAKKSSSAKDLAKQTQENVYRFLSAIAGDLPHYEEVLRALYAKDEKKFKSNMQGWPKDISHHAKKLASPLF